MNKAIFAGTFDPVHFGHIDIVQAAASLFDEVVWVCATNSTKKTQFPAPMRFHMMELVVDNYGWKNVRPEALPVESALVDVAEAMDARYLVRSFRLTADFEYELQLSLINRKLNSKVQTVYLPPLQEHIHISSTAVRELIRLDKPLTAYVPKYLWEFLIP